MARSRNIKPGFFLNDELAEIEPLGRLLFAGLWTIADREGRLEDRPKKIKAAVLPYDDCNIDLLLSKLAYKHFIIRYQVDGEEYIAIPNWKKHQNPHVKESPSAIPAPNEHHTNTIQEQDKHETSPADSLNLIPDSLNLIPDSLNLIPSTDGNMLDAFGRITNFILEKLQRVALSGIDSELIQKWLAEEVPEETIYKAVIEGIEKFKPKYKNDKIKSVKWFEPFIYELQESKQSRSPTYKNLSKPKQDILEKYRKAGLK